VRERDAEDPGQITERLAGADALGAQQLSAMAVSIGMANAGICPGAADSATRAACSQQPNNGSTYLLAPTCPTAWRLGGRTAQKPSLPIVPEHVEYLKLNIFIRATPLAFRDS
jgi:hypothetical protein